jgi:hypothetical protein
MKRRSIKSITAHKPGRLAVIAGRQTNKIDKRLNQKKYDKE